MIDKDPSDYFSNEHDRSTHSTCHLFRAAPYDQSFFRAAFVREKTEAREQRSAGFSGSVRLAPTTGLAPLVRGLFGFILSGFLLHCLVFLEDSILFRCILGISDRIRCVSLAGDFDGPTNAERVQLLL